MKKVQFVTAIHGDEYLPVLALANLGVKQLVANKNALILRKRFVEKDLNASFGTSGGSYEEKIARKILKKIDKNKIVLDLHTFSAKSEPFVVIVDLKMFAFAKKLGFIHIVYMKHNIKNGHALINYVNGVSIELGKHDDIKVFSRVVDLAKCIANNHKQKKTILYKVYGKIEKPGNYKNFKKYKNSFIPILAGEKSYNFYGLKGRKIDIL